jgi:hypothetical protein
MSNNNNNQQLSQEKVLTAVGAVLQALSGLSNSERTKVLKMVGGGFDLSVKPSMVVAQQAATSVSKSSKEAAKGVPGSAQKPNPANKRPEVVEVKAAIAANLKEIRAAKAALQDGEILANDHPLMVEKRQLEGNFKAFRGQSLPTKVGNGEGSSKSAQ